MNLKVSIKFDNIIYYNIMSYTHVQLLSRFIIETIVLYYVHHTNSIITFSFLKKL